MSTIEYVRQLDFDVKLIYFSEHSHAVLVFICAVLQHSIALFELIFASLVLLCSWHSAALWWCFAAAS